MKLPAKNRPVVLCLFALLSAPAFATVTVTSLEPSLASPQAIGTTITWKATATDTNTGPLAFQFSVTPPGGSLQMVKDFNLGSLSGGTWTAPSFVWMPTGPNGNFTIQVVAKDFNTGESNTQTIPFHVKALVTGSTPVAVHTANPLVALFNAPPCAAGSTMRVVYQQQGVASAPFLTTSWVACNPSVTMTFEVAGMYPSATYHMYAETQTGSNTANGPVISFETGALPKTLLVPAFTVVTPAADTNYPVLLHNFSALGTGKVYPDVATDLSGNVIWYYFANDGGDILTRPLPGGGIIVMENAIAWAPGVPHAQFLRQIDLAGNIVRETNMGALQQELLKLGSVDGGPCTAITNPAVGDACIGGFHHDAIQTLPGGYTAVLMDIEKIFPPGTQGDTSGLPVDIIGDMIVVLNTNWQAVWYFDVFNPKGGGNGYAKLPVTRTAPLKETCTTDETSCPPIFLLGPGIAPLAHDWLHANSLYYWPAPQDGNTSGGDIVWSSRHQDSIMRIDYQDGKGTGDIIWRMGPPDDLTPASDFTFTNTWNDPWPWFSHQHEVGMENGGTGPMTVFDNGNTRVQVGPPLGIGAAHCAPYDCHSRGMALTVNYDTSSGTGTVDPVVSFDLEYYSTAMGSAQLLSDGNYFFEDAAAGLGNGNTAGVSLELSPANPAPQAGPAVQLLNLMGPNHYRAWEMPSLYDPPVT
ncbi:MAG TPA: aryl-sulfate sulfotransferase [Bryobacteraceae bacterium]|jgi:hypothetical protein|nr:aryl-sulfate sulfotransferase [Bryobacteraceae bacterium]